MTRFEDLQAVTSCRHFSHGEELIYIDSINLVEDFINLYLLLSLQTVPILIECHIMQHIVWVFTVCLLKYLFTSIQNEKDKSKFYAF